MYLRTLFFWGLFTLYSTSAFAQLGEDLSLYGYFQGQYKVESFKLGGQKGTNSSFSLQQINLLLKKNFGERFSSFVDLESVNTYSTERGWGGMKFSEAWFSYNPNRKLNVKLGLQVPVFNNLNDIKNRTPLLPYLFRPVVYESSFNNFLQINTFVPDQAYVNVEGTLASNRLKFDYAVYAGNESEFVPPDSLSSIPASTDTTESKLFGGRIGIRRGSLKAGFSGTIDHANMQQLGMGAVRRYRMGADLSFAVNSFFVESEFISVTHNLSVTQEATLSFLSSQSLFLGSNLDKFYYYLLLGYRIGEQVTVYTSYDHLEDHALGLAEEGVNIFSVGAAYWPIYSAVLKIQFIDYRLKETSFASFQFSGQSLYAGISVFF